jgi:hypothetical protein
LLSNVWGTPVPGFGAYYAVLLAGLSAIFITFADGVVRDEEKSP